MKEHAYVPLTSIGRSPQGAGTDYEACNMLTKRRRNSFCCDGTARDYYLDGVISDLDTITCTLDGEEINPIHGGRKPEIHPVRYRASQTPGGRAG